MKRSLILFAFICISVSLYAQEIKTYKGVYKLMKDLPYILVDEHGEFSGDGETLVKGQYDYYVGSDGSRIMHGRFFYSRQVAGMSNILDTVRDNEITGVTGFYKHGKLDGKLIIYRDNNKLVLNEKDLHPQAKYMIIPYTDGKILNGTIKAKGEGSFGNAVINVKNGLADGLCSEMNASNAYEGGFRSLTTFRGQSVKGAFKSGFPDGDWIITYRDQIWISIFSDPETVDYIQTRNYSNFKLRNLYEENPSNGKVVKYQDPSSSNAEHILCTPNLLLQEIDGKKFYSKNGKKYVEAGTAELDMTEYGECGKNFLYFIGCIDQSFPDILRFTRDSCIILREATAEYDLALKEHEEKVIFDAKKKERFAAIDADYASYEALSEQYKKIKTAYEYCNQLLAPRRNSKDDVLPTIRERMMKYLDFSTCASDIESFEKQFETIRRLYGSIENIHYYATVLKDGEQVKATFDQQLYNCRQTIEQLEGMRDTYPMDLAKFEEVKKKVSAMTLIQANMIKMYIKQNGKVKKKIKSYTDQKLYDLFTKVESE